MAPAGQLDVLVRHVRQLAVPLDVALHPGVILVLRRGVNHDEVVLVGHLVDDEVIHNAALVVTHRAVAGRAGLQRRVIVRQYPVQEGQGIFAFAGDFAHVGHVEKTDSRADRHMLLQDSLKLDRQQIAAE